MTNLNQFSESLERAQRNTVIGLLRSHRDMTLAELAGLRETHGDLVGSITLDELISGRAGAAKGGPRISARKKANSKSGRRRGRPKKVDTRTAAGREAYDQAVLAATAQYEDSVSADEIRAISGGSAEQARSALARLVGARKVKRTGKGRGTRYLAS